MLPHQIGFKASQEGKESYLLFSSSVVRESGIPLLRGTKLKTKLGKSRVLPKLAHDLQSC
eukprot:8718055-Ditylum_brightwellii.AAC.1